MVTPIRRKQVLPPVQSVPVTDPSAAHKPLLIAVITVVVLIALSLLLFFGQKQFVGKAEILKKHH